MPSWAAFQVRAWASRKPPQMLKELVLGAPLDYKAQAL